MIYDSFFLNICKTREITERRKETQGSVKNPQNYFKRDEFELKLFFVDTL